MKPNKKQIKACEEISSQAKFWISTNDLSSPTHSCDIEEMMSGLVAFGDLTEDEASELEVKLIDLLIFVRSLAVC
jgi:hypothetical protein